MARKPIPGERPPGWTPPEGTARRSGGGKSVLLIAIAAAIGLVVIGSQLEESDKADRLSVAAGGAGSTPIFDVTPEQLREAYAANEVAAKASYDGKRLRIKGKIIDITLDITDSPVLRFETGERYQEVMATFDKADSATIAKLAKGQEATVVCDRISEVAGTPVLDDCTVS